MRKALLEASSSPRPRRSPSPRRPRARGRPRRTGGDPGLRQGLAQPRRGRRPHDRRRQPRVPALVRRRREDEAVEGLRPVQRQGLRVGGLVRGRPAARLHEGAGQVDRRARSTTRSARARSRSTSTSPRSRTRPSARRRSTSRSRTTSSTSRSSAARARRSRRRKSIAALKPFKLGAQVGTTSYTYITKYIKPSSSPLVFDTNDAAVQALKNGQIDGIVVDLPTAFYVTAVQVDDGVIVGKLPTKGTKERFGIVLPEGQSAPHVREQGARPTLARTGRSRSCRRPIWRVPVRPDLK